MAICYTNIRFYVWTTEIQAESKTSMCTKKSEPIQCVNNPWIQQSMDCIGLQTYMNCMKFKNGKNVSPPQQQSKQPPLVGASNPKLKDGSRIRPVKGYL